MVPFRILSHHYPIAVRYLAVISVLVLFYSSCSSPEPTDQPSGEYPNELLGMWIMNQVYEDSTNVTDAHNPALNRWIEFSNAGTFESGGAPYGYNSGDWRFDENENELFLDSDAGEEDDSYWFVEVGQDSMQWSGSRSEYAKRFTISFRKKGF